MKYRYYSFLILPLLLIGCKSYYQGGFAGNEFSQLPAPVYKNDATQSKHYISGGVSQGYEYFKNEDNNFLYLNYNYGVGAKYVTFGIGAKAYTGNYSVNSFTDDLSYLNRKYNYWGIQGQWLFGLNIPFSERFQWRVLNWQFSWNIERGDFYKFRRELSKVDDVIDTGVGFVDDMSNLAGHGYTEIVFLPIENLKVGLLAGVGTSVKHANLSSIIGGSLEYKQIGIKASKTLSTPNFVSSYATIFNDEINPFNNNWQLGIYYKL